MAALRLGRAIRVEWQSYAVVHITFNTIGYQSLGLEEAIVQELCRIGAAHDIHIEQSYAGPAFRELIDKLAVNQQVVILIDEYDKPIIDYLNDIPQAKANQQLLKSFYAVLKNAKRQIRFLFVTGVSKFSKVSIFSDLNNLLDISLNSRFNYLVGYAPEEVKTYFEAPIQLIATNKKMGKEELWQAIKTWYNGYSWDGEQFVYNPFSILCFLEEQRLRNFWFRSGTPSFLIHLLKDRFVYQLENMQVDDTVFESYNIEDIGVKSLLFQTGYLTIKAVNEHGIYTLDYPNEEVRLSMFKHLIPAFKDGGFINL